MGNWTIFDFMIFRCIFKAIFCKTYQLAPVPLIILITDYQFYKYHHDQVFSLRENLHNKSWNVGKISDVANNADFKALTAIFRTMSRSNIVDMPEYYF